jgi:hypothetical protein
MALINSNRLLAFFCHWTEVRRARVCTLESVERGASKMSLKQESDEVIDLTSEGGDVKVKQEDVADDVTGTEQRAINNRVASVRMTLCNIRMERERAC